MVAMMLVSSLLCQIAKIFFTNAQLNASPQVHPDGISLALNSDGHNSRTNDGENHGDDDQ